MCAVSDSSSPLHRLVDPGDGVCRSVYCRVIVVILCIVLSIRDIPVSTVAGLVSCGVITRPAEATAFSQSGFGASDSRHLKECAGERSSDSGEWLKINEVDYHWSP